MCLIVVIKRDSKEASINFALSELSIKWAMNDDGAGYAYARNGQVRIVKPFWKLSRLKKCLIRDIKKYNEKSDFVVHLRMATHGKRDRLNTHPHPIAKGRLALAHNGILTGFGLADKRYSDTVEYCRSLKSADPKVITSQVFREAMATQIGDHNKFAIINGEGHTFIINASAGRWENGSWFSAPKWPSIGTYKYAPMYGGASRPAGCGVWRKDGDAHVWEPVIADESEETYGQYLRRTAGFGATDDISDETLSFAQWSAKQREVDDRRALAEILGISVDELGRVAPYKGLLANPERKLLGRRGKGYRMCSVERKDAKGNSD